MKDKIVAIVVNTSWNIFNFRLGLLKALEKQGYKIVAIAPKDNYSVKLKAMGFDYYNIDINNKGTNPFEDIKLIYNFYKLYKKIRPDIILHYTIKPNIYGSIGAGILGISVINNISGLGTVFLTDTLVQKVTKKLYQYSLKRVDKVFFQNDEDKLFFIDNQLIDIIKVDLLPGSGVDTQKFTPRNHKNSHKKFIFLLIARVIKDKGIFEYVEAAKSIKENFENIEFQLLGELGSLNKGAIKEEKIKLWQTNNLITYLGQAEDVRDYIANCDCIVLPSYREGTSKTLLEASSMEKPIITTNVPGCNNIVIDEKNGFLCRVKDSKSLEEKMKKMIFLSDSEREIMGKKGRKKMISEFEEKIVIQKYLESIEGILKNKFFH